MPGRCGRRRHGRARRVVRVGIGQAYDAVGLLGRRFGLPVAVRALSVALGVVGLLSIPVTYGWLAIGIAERIPMYTFLAWAVVTGAALLASKAPTGGAPEA